MIDMMEKETRLLVRVVPCLFYRVPAMIDVNIEYDKGSGWISFYGTDLNRSTNQNIDTKYRNIWLLSSQEIAMPKLRGSLHF